MDASEIKKEIKKAIDKLSEDSMRELLGLLTYLEKHPEIDIKSVKQLNQIVNENRELLQKLAQ
jgi:hypothetical protein